MAYAENTSIAFEKSVVEIVTMIKRHGGIRIVQVEEDDGFVMQFWLSDRCIRFRVAFPTVDEMPLYNGRNQTLSQAARIELRQQKIRQKGRALMLVVKAKLESVESGVETFEQAFLANVVMADGSTVYERISQPIALEYQTGKPSHLLLGGPTDG